MSADFHDKKPNENLMSGRKLIDSGMAISFSECVEARDDAGLQVVVETTDERCARSLCEEFGNIGETVVYQVEGGNWQIGLLVQPDAAFDAALACVQEKLDRKSSRDGQARAELLETRLVTTSVIPSRGDSSTTVIGSFVLVASDTLNCKAHEICFHGGTAFGSGCHPSTRLAALMLEKTVPQMVCAKVLDVGCGSGILSLLSARLGAKQTVGVDICTDSLDVARCNVERNNLSDRVMITNAPLSQITGPFDLVLANLTLSVFYRLLADIGCLCRIGGLLIVSGMQGRQADSALARLQADKWELVMRNKEGKWHALMLRRI